MSHAPLSINNRIINELLNLLIWILAIIGSMISEDVRSNIQAMFSTLGTEGVVGFLIITQLTIGPLIAGWLSKILYRKYKSLK